AVPRRDAVREADRAPDEDPAVAAIAAARRPGRRGRIDREDDGQGAVPPVPDADRSGQRAGSLAVGATDVRRGGAAGRPADERAVCWAAVAGAGGLPDPSPIDYRFARGAA